MSDVDTEPPKRNASTGKHPTRNDFTTPEKNNFSLVDKYFSTLKIPRTEAKTPKCLECIKGPMMNRFSTNNKDHRCKMIKLSQ
jgi:hypothetical protein